MKAVTGAGLMALVWTLVAQAAPPDALQYGADVRAGKVDPATFDFEAAGFWELDATARKTWPFAATWVEGRENMRPDQGCEPVDLDNLALLSWAMPATDAADAAEWREARSQLAARLKKLDDMLAAKAREAEIGAEPRLVELMRRFARDQAIRWAMIDAAAWQDGLSRVAANSWGWIAGLRLSEIDCDNTRWLREQLTQVKWFDIPTYGKAADEAAWHLVQHADREPQFQRDMLPLLQSLPRDHTSQARIGYLWDRVAVKDGKPQRYGTQGSCQSDGTWKPHPVEDPDSLDARRQALGMEPIAEHALEVARVSCRPQPGN